MIVTLTLEKAEKPFAANGFIVDGAVFGFQIVCNRPGRERIAGIFESVFVYSKIFPSMEMVTTCHGMNFPLVCSAFFAAISKPPQQGTSIRRMVTP